MPCRSQTFLTCRRFSSECGWPPIRLVPVSMRTKAMFSAPLPGDRRLQLGDVHVALERMLAGDRQSLVDDEFFHRAAVDHDMGLRRGEVVVHRHDGARTDEDARDDVLGGAALMHGQEIFRAEQVADLVFELGEGRRARIAVVGLHHRRQLLVAHGVDAAVGQHVEIDIAVLQQKRVVAGFIQSLKATLDRRQAQLLNNADLVHLQRDFLAGIEFDVGHGAFLTIFSRKQR